MRERILKSKMKMNLSNDLETPKLTGFGVFLLKQKNVAMNARVDSVGADLTLIESAFEVDDLSLSQKERAFCLSRLSVNPCLAYLLWYTVA